MSRFSFTRSSAVVALSFFLLGCAVPGPAEPEVPGFADRALDETQSQDGVTVGVEIPTPDELEAEFNLPLLTYDFWPVWLSVENRSSARLLFSPVDFDPEHFSPGEIAWATAWASPRGFEAERADLDRRQFPLVVEPGATASGFIYADLTRGARFFSVVLYSRQGTYRFVFGEVAPGFQADFLRVDLENIYRGDEIRELTEVELREYVGSLPQTVLGGDQETPGDPLNIVLVGDGESLLMAFGEQNWDITETTTTSSALKTIGSSLFRKQYRTSPVSALYLFDRQQDFALQKARHTVDERNHLRLWLAPVTYGGQSVWVGQISRDIGVKFAERTFVTHKIDPDVDEARNYLLFDLVQTGWFPAFAFAKGVGETTVAEPRYNYTDDPYITDGYRLVLFHSGEGERNEDIEMLNWEMPPPPSRN